MPEFVMHGGAVDEAEATAAIAAVLILLEAPVAQPAVSPPDRWHDSTLLTVQGMQPVRVPTAPRWGTIERLRRAGRSGSGIVGL